MTTHLTKQPPGTGTWAAYANALSAVHHTRDAAVCAQRAARRDEAARREAVAGLAARAAEQRHALTELAKHLRVSLPPAEVAPTPVPACPPAEAVADLRARLDAADSGLAETRRVAALPQLLPDWPSDLARAAVVYAAFAVPNVMLTVVLTFARVDSNNLTAALWFLLVWPAVTALAGGEVVAHVGRPRLPADQPGGAVGAGATTGVLGAGRKRRYRWLGLLLAWGLWYAVGKPLELLLLLGPGGSTG